MDIMGTVGFRFTIGYFIELICIQFEVRSVSQNIIYSTHLYCKRKVCVSIVTSLISQLSTEVSIIE